MKKSIFLFILFLCFQGSYSQRTIDLKYQEKNDNSVDFYYSKSMPGSYCIKIEFKQLENCKSRKKIYEKTVSENMGLLFTLRPEDENRRIFFSYSSNYAFGNPKPKINNDIIYALPFKEGKSVSIIEAKSFEKKYFGDEEPENWKSFIAYSKSRDTVCAMRKGIVVYIVDEHDTTNADVLFTTKRNKIVIEHKDGSYASYKGFDKNEIFVELGQKIYPHTKLGILTKDKENNLYHLGFSVYHYLGNLLSDETGTLKNSIRRTKYLNPIFSVNNQKQNLKSKEVYTATFNDEIRLQEFSRREKRKYKKNPSDFK